MTSADSGNIRPRRPARRGVCRPLPPGRTAVAARSTRPASRPGRRHPRLLPGHGRDGAGQGRRWTSRSRSPLRPGRRASAAGRLPHPPRGRPRRHGRRLRGRAGLARPARRPQGAAAAAAARTPSTKQPLRARGEGGGEAAPHQHRAGLRRRRARRPALLRHAVHPGPGPGRGPRGAATGCSPGRAARRRPTADRRRARVLRRDVSGGRRGPVAADRRVPCRRRTQDAKALADRVARHRDRRPGVAGRQAAPATSRRRHVGRVSSSSVLVRDAPGQRRHDGPGKPASRPTGRAWPASACRWPRPWSTPTARASCTATSSRRNLLLDIARHRLGDRLRPGQGGRPAEPDAHRRHPRHAALHAAGGVRGQERRPRRRLLARA